MRSPSILATFVVGLAVVCGTSPVGAAGQAQEPTLDELLPPDPEMRAHFDVSVEMVRIPVIVEGPLGGFVAGMGADDFRVVEGGEPPRPVRHLVADDASSSLGILVDVGAEAGRIQAAIRDALAALVSSLREGDEAFLVRFGDDVDLLQQFTESRQDLLAAVTEVTSTDEQGRALHDALALSLIRMRNARHDKRALVVLAQGGDRGSRVDPADLRRAARRDGVAIHAVVLRAEEARWRDRVEDHAHGSDHDVEDHQEHADEVGACGDDSPSSTACLQQLAHDTGGLVALRPGIEDRFGGVEEWLRVAAGDVGDYVRNHYVLVYQPGTLPPRGAWRQLAVRVAVPFSKIRARPGYVR